MVPPECVCVGVCVRNRERERESERARERERENTAGVLKRTVDRSSIFCVCV